MSVSLTSNTGAKIKITPPFIDLNGGVLLNISGFALSCGINIQYHILIILQPQDLSDYLSFDTYEKNYMPNSIIDDLLFVEDVLYIENIEVYSEHFNNTTQSGYVYIMPSSLFELNKLKLKEGSLLTQDDTSDGIVDVLIADQYHNLSIGDVVSSNIESMQIRVAGIIEYPSYIMNLTTSGNYIAASNLFYKLDSLYEGRSLLICLDGRIDDVAESITSQPNMIVRFEPDISISEFNANCISLEEYGFVSTPGNIVSSSKRIISDSLTYYTPSIIVLSFFGMLGIFISVAIKNITSKKIFAILLVHGCTRFQLLFINVLQSIYIVAVTKMFLAIYFELPNHWYITRILDQENEISGIVVLSILAIYILITIIIPNISLYRKSLVVCHNYEGNRTILTCYEKYQCEKGKISFPQNISLVTCIEANSILMRSSYYIWIEEESICLFPHTSCLTDEIHIEVNKIKQILFKISDIVGIYKELMLEKCSVEVLSSKYHLTFF